MTIDPIEEPLQNICIKLIENLKLKYDNISGICYLTGHILERAFSSLGFKANEVSGILYLKDINGNWIIYGPDKYKKFGKLVGFYHTWCSVVIKDIEYIVDPTIIINRNYLKKFNIKLSKHLPDHIVSSQSTAERYKYEMDDTLKTESRKYLEKISDFERKEFIDKTIYNIKIELNI